MRQKIKKGEVYNITVGDCTAFNDLYAAIKTALSSIGITGNVNLFTKKNRVGMFHHTQADTAKSERIRCCPGFKILESVEKALTRYKIFYKKFL